MFCSDTQSCSVWCTERGGGGGGGARGGVGEDPGSVCPFFPGRFSCTISSLAGQELSELRAVFPQHQDHGCLREVVPVGGFYGLKCPTSRCVLFILNSATHLSSSVLQGVPGAQEKEAGCAWDSCLPGEGEKGRK